MSDASVAFRSVTDAKQRPGYQTPYILDLEILMSTTHQGSPETSRSMKKRIQSLAAITFTLAAFAVQPTAEAVVPPPDGGYPGFNTAEGQNALSSRTTGVGNTAVGWFSLFSNTDGSFNTGLGAGTFSTWETKARAMERKIRLLARLPF